MFDKLTAWFKETLLDDKYRGPPGSGRTPYKGTHGCDQKPTRPPGIGVEKIGREELFQRYAAGERYFIHSEIPKKERIGFMLAGSNLSYSTLSAVDFSGADLSSVCFVGADLSAAVLSGADLTHAKLKNANLENADLRKAEGLQLDSNLIRGAKFSPNANDPWSILRRNYTGIMFAFHLILMILFLLPYGVRTGYWIVVTHGQTALMELSEEMEKSVLPEVSPQSSPQITQVQKLTPCLAKSCHTLPVWLVLLEWDRPWYYSLLAFALLFYNGGRLVLTRKVGTLYDEEVRSGYSPPIEKYSVLVAVHRGVTVLFYISVFSFLWHIVDFFSLSVSLPARP